jgi:carbon-monoxide dehydrogenase medium subunit
MMPLLLSLGLFAAECVRRGVPKIPGPFEYHAAGSVPDAIALLERYGEDAKLLAGGQSLIPLMRFRLAQPAHLVDIGRIDGLAYVRESDGYLQIGAMTREADLESSPLVAERYPILIDASSVIADPLVRNLATVGGNVAHADPANDHPAVMLALRAEVVAEGPRGRRTVSIDDFFVDTFTTALEPDELLVEIRIPSPVPSSGEAYLKLERKVGDYAIAGVAVHVVLNAQGRFAQVGIGLTNVGPKPLPAAQAEVWLVGEEPTEATLRRAGELAAQEAQPIDDLRGPADYKRSVVRNLTVRALRRAVERARSQA